jgi:biotin transport system substrate-specific component
MEKIFSKWDEIKFDYYSWRKSTTVVNKIILSILWACITGLLAQIRIPLPWTPVPVTGQTFAVITSGVVLGSIWGGVSQLIYIAVGIVLIPWFQGFKGGFSVILGPTGGYLVGFVMASFVIGYLYDHFASSRNFLKITGILLLVNFIFVYTPGLIQLSIWTKVVKGNFPGFFELLSMGFLPFIIGDFIKVLISSGIIKVIGTKRNF